MCCVLHTGQENAVLHSSPYGKLTGGKRQGEGGDKQRRNALSSSGATMSSRRNMPHLVRREFISRCANRSEANTLFFFFFIVDQRDVESEKKKKRFILKSELFCVLYVYRKLIFYL